MFLIIILLFVGVAIFYVYKILNDRIDVQQKNITLLADEINKLKLHKKDKSVFDSTKDNQNENEEY